MNEAMYVIFGILQMTNDDIVSVTVFGVEIRASGTSGLEIRYVCHFS